MIGHDGRLPWSYPDDRAHFERTTAGHAVIMGRRTFEETGEALAGRFNVVVSRSTDFPDGIARASTLEQALELAYRADPEPIVIGGAELFRAALPLVTRAWITEIPQRPAGDTVFAFDDSGFELVSERVGTMGERYREYRRA